MAIILAIQEAEIRKIRVPSQPGQKVHETLSQPIKARCDFFVFHPSYVGRINRRIVVQVSTQK
jgi:hypothetical protein